MKNGKKSFGDWGERRAESFLVSKNYQIIERKLRYPVGEVDLIALKNNVIYFIEVKTRSNLNYGQGWEAVGSRKIQRISKVAEIYLSESNLDMEVRIGIISILKDRENELIDFFLI